MGISDDHLGTEFEDESIAPNVDLKVIRDLLRRPSNSSPLELKRIDLILELVERFKPWREAYSQVALEEAEAFRLSTKSESRQ